VVSVTVSGPALLRLKAAAQFTVKVTGTANATVTWQVNGVAGGSAANGTITSKGIYTAPATLPATSTVTISAVSAANGATGSAGLRLLNLNPVLTAGKSVEAGVSTSYTIDISGTGILPGAQILVDGVAIPTVYLSPKALTGTATVAANQATVIATVMNPMTDGTVSNAIPVAVLHALVTETAAARLLDQATFGPRLSDIQQAQQLGLDGYLTQQFSLPVTKLAAIPAIPIRVCTSADLIPCEQSEWWQAVLTAPDQVRMRVAFALSEIFVVSTNAVDARAVASFQNTLAADAFGNWATLMKDVTLSPAMGAYLNMLNSAKAPAGQIANENYARELMQLFTTGIDELNPDGTLVLDANGNPVPVYTETQVEAFARVYTGWTYSKSDGTSPASFPNPTPNYTMPMAAVESAHDMTSKTLLSGTVLPPAQTAEQDLAEALANLFAQPNVGPFVCRQLIQHLVSSQPSPAYVARVAAVFANDGHGVRGNMQAVIRAILEDTEARAGDTNPNADGGHLREAMLWTANVLRNLGAVNTSSGALDYSSLSGYTSALGEEPYSAGSVFNFFTPEYLIPGSSTNAPEFGQENTASTILRLSLADSVVHSEVSNFKIDLSATSPLGQQASWSGVAAVDAGALVDQLGLMFLHGQMPAAMRTAIVNQVAGISDVGQRVRVAAYLVITASQYKVEN
jgi:uncharacterized protein (DUF1800 family)